MESNTTLNVTPVTSPGPPSDSVEAEWLLAYFHTVQTLALCIGLPGNCLSLAVLTRKRMRNHATNIYLAAIATSDSCYSLVYLLPFWLFTFSSGSIDVWRYYHYNGKEFVIRLVVTVSNWLVVAVSVDRLIAVMWPLKFTVKSNTPLIVICLVVSSSIIINIPTAFLWKDSSHPGGVCLNLGNSTDYVLSIRPWVDIMAYSLIPCLVVVVVNCALINAYRRTRSKRTAVSSNQIATRKLEQKMTFMLLAVSFLMVVCTLPICVAQLIPSVTTGYSVLYTVSESMMFINHSANFYLYCLTGTTFRREMKIMFSSLRCARNRIFPEDTMSYARTSRAP